MVKNLPANTGDAKDVGLIPGPHFPGGPSCCACCLEGQLPSPHSPHKLRSSPGQSAPRSSRRLTCPWAGLLPCPHCPGGQSCASLPRLALHPDACLQRALVHTCFPMPAFSKGSFSPSYKCKCIRASFLLYTHISISVFCFCSLSCFQGKVKF